MGNSSVGVLDFTLYKIVTFLANKQAFNHFTSILFPTLADLVSLELGSIIENSVFKLDQTAIINYLVSVKILK